MKRGKTPTREQVRFHGDMASLGCYICGATAAVHHCVGSSARHNKVDIGQWWVIPLCEDHHQYGPESVHQSPLVFAELVGCENRKEAEKEIWWTCVQKLESEARDAENNWHVPLEVCAAIDGYHR